MMKQWNNAHSGDHNSSNANAGIPRVGLTIEEASLYSGIGQSTLRELVSWGKVPGLMVGRKIIIHINILDFFMRVNQGRNLRDRDQVVGVEYQGLELSAV